MKISKRDIVAAAIGVVLGMVIGVAVALAWPRDSYAERVHKDLMEKYPDAVPERSER